MNQDELEKIVKRSIELKKIINSADSELEMLNKTVENLGGYLNTTLNTKHQLISLFSKVCRTESGHINYDKNRFKNFYLYCVQNDHNFALKIIQSHKQTDEIRKIAFDCLLDVDSNPYVLFKNRKYLFRFEKQEVYKKYHEVYFKDFCNNALSLSDYCLDFRDCISPDVLEYCIDFLMKSNSPSFLRSLKSQIKIPIHLLEKIDSYLVLNELSV